MPVGRTAACDWSPDGARLAFVSSRGNHGFIGVYDAAAKTVHYLDPSVDQDDAPGLVARQPACSVRAHPQRGRTQVFRAVRERSAVVHPGGRCRAAAANPAKRYGRHAEGDGSVFRELGSEQQLYLGRRPAGVSVGARRLDASVFRAASRAATRRC